MLGTMRKLSKTLVFKALMVLLVVSFGIWGIGDMFKGNPGKRELAKIGSVPVTVQEFLVEFQKNMPEARKRYGSDLTVDQAKKLGLYEQTLQMMIDRSALDQETRAQGVIVGRDVVLKKLAALPQFRNADGTFNAPLFQQALNRNGLTEAGFFEMESREMARMLLLNTMGGISAPKTIIDHIYRARGEKRILEVLTIRNDSVRDIKQPDETAMQAYYEEHQQDFVAPEIRGLTVASLSVPALEKEIAITDEMLRKSFDQQAASLTRPETRDLIQIVVPEKEKADEIAAKAAAAKDLSKAAKAAGLTPISMTKVDEQAVLPELYTALYGLEEGAVSPAIKSDMGYHVLQVKKINPAGKPSFEAVKDELRENLKQEKISELLAQKMKDWDDAVGAGTPLEEIADSLKLRLTRVAAVDQMGFDPAGKKVDAVPMADRLVPLAFDQNQGDVSQIIDDGKDTYYVVRTDSVTASHVMPFETVKAKIKTAMIEMAQAESTAKMAHDIAEEIRKGKSATSFASRPGVEVRLSKPISLLGERDKELPPESVREALKMKKGEVSDIPDAKNKAHLVLRMADIVQVDAKRPEASRIKVVDEMKEAIPYDLVGLFSAYTKQEFPVSINSKLLESLKAQSDEAK